jgi:hypothetical protein
MMNSCVRRNEEAVGTGNEFGNYCFEPHLLQKVADAGSDAPQLIQNFFEGDPGGAGETTGAAGAAGA